MILFRKLLLMAGRLGQRIGDRHLNGDPGHATSAIARAVQVPVPNLRVHLLNPPRAASLAASLAASELSFAVDRQSENW